VIEGSIFANFAKIGVQLEVESGSTFIRLNLLKNTGYILAETNYLGAGIANFGYYLNPFLNFYGIVNPHNWWVELITEHGILISVLFVIMILWMLLQLYRIYKIRVDNMRYTSLALFCSIIGFIIGSMAPSSMFYFWPMWLFIGLALATINVHKMEQRQVRKKLNDNISMEN